MQFSGIKNVLILLGVPFLVYELFIQMSIVFQINLDFEEMYEEQSLNFFKNWHFFFEKLLKLKQDQIKNETGLSLLETLFALKDDGKYLSLFYICTSFYPRLRLRVP